MPAKSITHAACMGDMLWQERRKKEEEEEAERQRQILQKMNAMREQARRRASMPHLPIADPRTKMRILAKQALSLPRLSVDLQVGAPH